MDLHSRFIAPAGVLDPAAIRAAGLAAAPFPEVAGDAEIAGIGAMAGAAQARLWAWGHAQPPRVFGPVDFAQAGALAFREGHDDVLIGASIGGDAPLLIWLPGTHDYFVVAAPAPLLARIGESGIFPYAFDDYRAEPFFRGRRAAALDEIARTYAIPGAAG